MSFTPKGLSGSPTLRAWVGDNSPVERGFIDYGYVEPPVIASSFETQRANVVDLGIVYDSIEIIGPPTHGKMIGPRKDGRFTWDMTGAPYIAGPIDDTVTWRYARNGVTQEVTRTYSITPAQQPGGWGKEDWLRLETDPVTDRYIVEPPPENFRKIYITPASNGGLTYAQIAALEGLSESTITSNWLFANKATGQDLYYGETEALALAQHEGEWLSRRLTKDAGQFNSFWLLYERGFEYGPSEATSFSDRIGDSRLHPCLVGNWGAGADIFFDGSTPMEGGNYGHFLVRQDIACNSDGDTMNASWIATDGYTVIDSKSYAFTVTTLNVTSFGNSFRRLKIYDLIKTDGGARWTTSSGDRHSGMFASGQVGLFVEKVYSDLIGWAPGYSAWGDPALPKIPEIYSHNFYISLSNVDVTVQDIIATRPTYNMIQLRPGGVMKNIFGGKANAGSWNGKGPTDPREWVESEAAGNWSLTFDYLEMQAGYNDVWAYRSNWAGAIGFADVFDPNAGHVRLAVLSQGYRVQAGRTMVDRMLIMDAGPKPPVYQNNQEIGPRINPAWVENGNKPNGPGGEGHAPFMVQTSTGSSIAETSRYATAMWNDYPDFHSEGSFSDFVTPAELAAMTTAALCEELTGSPGDMTDIALWLRQFDRPWDEIKQINARRLDPVFGGPRSTRTVGQLCTFRPNGETPGNRADIELDWDTGDLPGTFPGDSVDDDGHEITWNQGLYNNLEEYFLNGHLVVKGDAVRLNGDIIPHASGRQATVHHGRLYVGGKSGGYLLVDAMDGRFVNKGGVAGTIEVTDVFARYKAETILGYEGSSFLLNSGRYATILGGSRPGFDGITGAASEIDFAAGSYLRFWPTIKMTVTGLLDSNEVTVFHNSNASMSGVLHPHKGSVVRGLTSGATAKMRDFMQISRTAAHFILDGMSGPFTPGEPLFFEDMRFAGFNVPDLSGLGITSHGAVGNMEVTLGTLKEWRTGMHGETAPDISSSVILNANLQIDVANLANGVYPLIQADSITGSPGSVSASNNATKAITLAQTATELTLTVADGFGQVN